MSDKLSIAFRWGSRPEEWGESFPCDPWLPDCENVLQRGIDIRAPCSVVFRWLCQMKVAPYSYDWIDNFGRESPRELTPGAERLATGDRVMTIFELADFRQDDHLTLRLAHPGAVRVFGEIALTYRLRPTTSAGARLAVRMRLRYPQTGIWSAMRWLLPWGDLIMMRKQLRVFKWLAERDYAESFRPMRELS